MFERKKQRKKRNLRIVILVVKKKKKRWGFLNPGVVTGFLYHPLPLLTSFRYVLVEYEKLIFRQVHSVWIKQRIIVPRKYEIIS